MAVETPTPVPRLAEAAQEAQEARRAQKRANNPIVKALRKVAVVLAMLFAVLGLGGGVAQAWPWDVADNIEAFVTHFCDPMDAPTPVGHQGVDTLFGLNNVEDSNIRHTIVPENAEDGAGDSQTARERLHAGYGGGEDGGLEGALTHPQYERYGFSTLHWNNYGASCFSVGYWFSPISNFALMIFVHIPMIISMVVLEVALGNILYDVFAALIAPFISIFTEIFTPWIFFIAPFGILFVWLTKRSTQAVAKAGVWIIAIFGVFLWMGNNTSTVVSTANNFVTEIAGTAADAINENNQGHDTGEDIEADGSALGSIHQSLWYGIPYQTWAEGQVGPGASSTDREAERGGELGLAAAILNSHYAGNDDDGADVRANVQYWNSLTYAPGDSEEEKTGYWTGADGGSFWTGREYNDAAWVDVPYLFNVKAICNDTVTSDQGGSDAEEHNLWMYADNCDSATAGTANMVPYFTGENYNQRMITAFTGGVGATAVSLSVAGAAIYLAVQKMVFYFLLLFAPIFLAISTFADDKRRAFATRYFGVLAGNIIKQAVAVLVVLFVANSMSLLMYPPAGETFAALRDMPWILRPLIAVLFFIALVLFAIPLKKIVTSAVKGDTNIVQKTADAPKNASKGAAKAAAIGGLVVATGGVGGVAAGGAAAGGGLGSALGGAKGAAMLQTAGRAAGARGGMGKALTTAGRLSSMRNQVGSAMAQSRGNKEALANGVKTMTSGKRGQEYVSAMAQKPGMVNPDGSLTKKGTKQAEKDFMATSKAGAEKQMGAQMQAAQMKQWFEGHKAKTGEFHELDPQNPQNIKAAKVAHEQERQGVYSEASANRKRGEYQGNAQNVSGSGQPQNVAAPNAASNDGQANANAANANAANAGSSNNNDSGHSPTSATMHDNNVREAFANQARGNMEGPSFGRDENIKATVQVSGADVLSQMGMDRAGAAANPTALLSSSAYNGGDTSRMDPAHPATPAMNDLRFAMLKGSNVEGDQAMTRASEAISAHGVPDQISSIGSTGSTAQTFEPMKVVGAMPNITDDTPWQERSEAATTMQAASAMVPTDSPAAAPMQHYVSALGNPSVKATELDGLKVQAMDAFSEHDQGYQPPLFGDGAASAVPIGGASAAFAGGAPTDAPTPQADASPAAQPAAGPGPMQDALPGMENMSTPADTGSAPTPQADAPPAAQPAAATPSANTGGPTDGGPGPVADSAPSPASNEQSSSPSFADSDASAPQPTTPAASPSHEQTPGPAPEAPQNYEQASGPAPESSPSFATPAAEQTPGPAPEVPPAHDQGPGPAAEQTPGPGPGTPQNYEQTSGPAAEAGPSFAMPVYGAGPDHGGDRQEPANEAPPNYGQSDAGQQSLPGMSREDLRDVLREANEDARISGAANYEQPTPDQGPGPAAEAGPDDVSGAQAATPPPMPTPGPQPEAPAQSYDSPPSSSAAEQTPGPSAQDDDEIQQYLPTRRRRRSSFFDGDGDTERQEEQEERRRQKEEEDWWEQWRNRRGEE